MKPQTMRFAADPIIIGIDAGHGGSSNGCKVGDRSEKNVVLDLAFMLYDSLKQSPLIEPIMIRNSDQKMGFKTRGSISAEAGCKFVLPIHVNAISNPAIHGWESYYRHASPISYDVAIQINQVASCWFDKRRAIDAYDSPESQRDNWLSRPQHVVEAHACPTVLAECLYGSNAEDLKFLSTLEGLETIATILRGGLVYAAARLSSGNEAP